MIRVNDVTCMYYMNSRMKGFDVIAATCTGMTWSIKADMNPLKHVESFCIIYGFMSALKSLSRRSLKDHTGPWLNLCWHRILMRWMIYNETYEIAILVQRFWWNMRQSEEMNIIWVKLYTQYPMNTTIDIYLSKADSNKFVSIMFVFLAVEYRQRNEGEFL